ncbi:MAG: ABC transporter substrate-binding protein [Aerococcaceae bacterium]|nr:ABC transporter substrate-binding protein [Aerococcaceae bacterium]
MFNIKKMFRTMSAVVLTSATLASTVVAPIAQAQDVKTVTMYQIGTPPENLDQLLAKVNEISEKEIGVKLEMKYIGWGEYSEKMTVMTNSGEKYDIARADDYLNNAQKGAYADLTDLIKEHASESFAMLDEAYIKGNTIDGKLYAFPVNGNVYAQQFFTFNPTFLEKYDLKLDNIKTLADLEPLLEAVKNGEPTVAPLAAGRGWRVGHDFDLVLDETVPLGVDLLGDTAKIVNPYETGDAYIPDLKTMHDFYNKGYVPADAATSDQGYELTDDTWFVRSETVGPRDYGNYLLTAVSGKDLQIVPYSQLPLKSVAQARMSNFVIAQNSDNKVEAVKLLNLLNSNPEVLNILIYGIEGENWTKNEDGTIKLLPNYNGPTHMSAWNTGNAEILYKDERITPEQIAASEKGLEEAVTSPLLGFNFKTDAVVDEITNVKNVVAQYISGLHTGTVNPEEVLPQFNEELKAAGLDKIQEEMQRQFDEFLKSQN